MKGRWRKTLWLLGLFALVLATFCGVARYSSGTSHVMVRIVSDPPAASVYAGNEYAGVTPLTISLADGERKELRLVKREHLDGRVSLDSRDYVPEGFARRLAYAFRATVYEKRVSLAVVESSSLVLVSQPDGAAVFLDGQRVGATPFARDNMRPGRYTIRLEHPDCFPLTFPLQLASGRETRRHETLKNRVVELYKELIAKEPINMVHHSDLVHYHVLRGEFEQAVEAVRNGIAVVKREKRNANMGRFTAEIQHVYSRYYTYPEETETNKIRSVLRNILENAVKEDGPEAKHWRNCLKQMDRYDQAHSR